MEDNIILYASISLVLFLLMVYKLCLISKRTHENLPPSPPSLPILGHLHLLKPPTYRTFHKLSQKYGPVMSLKFGSRLVVIVASPLVVEECFTKNDIILANRPRLTANKYISYNYNTISSASYGDLWRNLRRIGSVEIFSNHRLNLFSSIRKDEIKRLLIKLGRDSLQNFSQVEMKSLFTNLTFNIIMKIVAGKRYCGDDVAADEEEAAQQFKELIRELFRSGAANPQDFLPIWKWIKGASYEKMVKELAKKSDKFLQGLIDEHRSRKENNGIESNTMMDHLLSLQESQPEYYSDEIIKGLILVMLLGGTDTSAITLEWAMANLLNHPDVLDKAKAEVDIQIGQQRLIDESDLSKLPYLQNIVSETLRLYPAAPLLVPHCASQDCSIGGYKVPRETIVMINAWAIHRDPTLWDDATRFKPERFEVDGRGEACYKLMPFGLGRRACPGSGMARRVVGLTLGSLIQCFEWTRPAGQELVDMSEGMGNTMPKAQPLLALLKPRQIMTKILPHLA